MVDNFSSHTAHAVEAWLAVHPRLQLYDLPTYCAQRNPGERIGLRRKHALAAHRRSRPMPRFLATLEACFRPMTPEQALKWAAAEHVTGTFCYVLSSTLSI